jgi:hypothetical protein
VLDTLFGTGPVGCGKALVEAWEEEGSRRMGLEEDIEERLRERLRYSAEVGEHLVEVGLYKRISLIHRRMHS